jgi:hypothetical protein
MLIDKGIDDLVFSVSGTKKIKNNSLFMYYSEKLGITLNHSFHNCLI